MWVSYQSRDDEGTQPPIETLDRGWGSCRDIALLLIKAVRRLGFGARIVSGYLANRINGSSCQRRQRLIKIAFQTLVLPVAPLANKPRAVPRRSRCID